uniref:Costars family protein ABRACL n=1 Tax=Coturnix japonica TaxID=93934 RepID=A0A8C2TAF9_COTJA
MGITFNTVPITSVSSGISELKECLQMLSCFVFDLDADGQVSVKFGVLFADEKCANLFEALVGTLKAAKRRKIVTYQGELLLQEVFLSVCVPGGFQPGMSKPTTVNKLN